MVATEVSIIFNVFPAHAAYFKLLLIFAIFSRSARVAVVKSRDMHWSLLAQRDQRDVSLSSLRMLIVADGANPCEYKDNISCFHSTT